MHEYRLLQPHKVNKTLHPAGVVLEVNDELGNWWISQGIAEAVNQPAAPKFAPSVARASVPDVGIPRAVVAPPARFKCCGWR